MMRQEKLVQVLGLAAVLCPELSGQPADAWCFLRQARKRAGWNPVRARRAVTLDADGGQISPPS
jgi:hypothetical protein